MKLSDFRKTFPSYDDMSDEELTAALHSTHFSDIPVEEFTKEFHAPSFDYQSKDEPFSPERLKFELGLVKNKKTSKTAVMLPDTAALDAKEVSKLASAAKLKAIRHNGSFYLFDPKQIKERELRQQITQRKEGHALGYGTDTVPDYGVDFAVTLDGTGTVDPYEIKAARDANRIGFAGKAPTFDHAVAKIREMGRSDAEISGMPQPMEARAKGGPVQPGTPYLVGEKGPEIIIPSQPGTVVPSGTSMEYLMGMNRRGAVAPHFPQGGDTRTFQQYDKSNSAAHRQLQPIAQAVSDPFIAIGGNADAQRRVLAKVAQATTDPMVGGVTHFSSVPGKAAKYGTETIHPTWAQLAKDPTRYTIDEWENIIRKTDGNIDLEEMAGDADRIEYPHVQDWLTYLKDMVDDLQYHQEGPFLQDQMQSHRAIDPAFSNIDGWAANKAEELKKINRTRK